MSCSAIGESSDSIKTAIKWSSSMGIPSFMFTATEKEGMDEKITQIIQGTLHYHTSEILSLMLTYQLIHGAGFSCPTINKSIKKKSSEDYINFYDQDVPPGMENEKNQISIDFDGVIHSFDLGWHDGTCYGKPIPGSLEAIKQISKNYDVIIHTAKIKNDRPHVNGKTGRQLVEEWLEKYGFTEYIKELTSEKPRAKYYIDDKAIKFVNWEETLKEIMG